MNIQVLDARSDARGGYKVDVSRGEQIGRVSSEWFSRPADERYLSLSELAHSVRDRADRSRTRVVESALIHVEANRRDPERLALILPGTDTPIAPTHWSFGQLAGLVGAPAAYLRQLPGEKTVPSSILRSTHGHAEPSTVVDAFAVTFRQFLEGRIKLCPLHPTPPHSSEGRFEPRCFPNGQRVQSQPTALRLLMSAKRHPHVIIPKKPSFVSVGK